ncbi:DNA N6-methyl adenine demethylase [Aphis craccivora]|uniref:DNA N6-methyl adenine demethylase n=1 Tax=Aphis craccivora TaxID=307492 RepID=A0A6G0ZQX6_APHCR|nr:DNA N6-methyl adenine demethylase [Aphis craccivora]
MIVNNLINENSFYRNLQFYYISDRFMSNHLLYLTNESYPRGENRRGRGKGSRALIFTFLLYTSNSGFSSMVSGLSLIRHLYG